MTRKLGLLFALYFCQGLPGGFLAVALPVILREQGKDLTTVTLASALSLPWVLKVLWSPLVDRYGSARFGRRKSWIVPAQLGILASTLLLAGTDPTGDLVPVVLLFLLLNFFAATQDIGTDGLAVDVLDDRGRGPGNAAQVGGFKLGNIFGGGVLLALSGTIGWSGDFLLMGMCVAAAMLLLVATPEHELSSAPREGPRSVAEVARTLWAAMRAQGPWLWLFLVYAKLGETFGGALVEPMLVDRGFSREQIGTLAGVFGGAATIVGAVLGGLIARRAGWSAAIATMSVVQGAGLIAIGVYQTGAITPAGIAALIALEKLGGGGVAVGVFALAMSVCRPAVGASQFTAAQVVYMSGAVIGAPLAGIVGDAIDAYMPVMVAGGAMAVVLAMLAAGPARRLGR